MRNKSEKTRKGERRIRNKDRKHNTCVDWRREEGEVAKKREEGETGE